MQVLPEEIQLGPRRLLRVRSFLAIVHFFSAIYGVQMHLFDIDIPGKITFKESDTLSPGNDVTVVNTGKK